MGDEHPGNRAGDRGLEVLGKPAAAAEPGEGAFEHPSARQDAEARGALGTLDDLKRPSPALGQRRAQLVAGVAAVGKDVPQPGLERASARQNADGAVAILDIGGVNLHADQMAFGVGDDVALAPLDLLAGI